MIRPLALNGFRMAQHVVSGQGFVCRGAKLAAPLWSRDWSRIFDLDLRVRVSHDLATLKLAPASKSAH